MLTYFWTPCVWPFTWSYVKTQEISLLHSHHPLKYLFFNHPWGSDQLAVCLINGLCFGVFHSSISSHFWRCSVAFPSGAFLSVCLGSGPVIGQSRKRPMMSVSCYHIYLTSQALESTSEPPGFSWMLFWELLIRGSKYTWIKIDDFPWHGWM